MDPQYQIGMARILAGVAGSGADFIEIGKSRTTSVQPVDRVRQRAQTPEGHTDATTILDYGGPFEVKAMIHDVSTAKLAAVVDYFTADGEELLNNDEVKVVQLPTIVVIPDDVVATADTSTRVWTLPAVEVSSLAALLHAIGETDSPVEFTGRTAKLEKDAADMAVPAGKRFGYRGVCLWADQFPAGIGAAV